ncbi:unnamed protein product [Brachionus calyciflorus]|uniref:Uncharacterized protein n=1 Tax=Brachionus calyciflorus TaxID=104777 RepID=A0A813WSY6_9BILA|nr:unnamed protein product [Brachionus calyciflorus]
MRNYFYLALISLVLASSVDCFFDDEDIKYLTGAYCIKSSTCDRNGIVNICECPNTDRDHFEDYNNLQLFCSETTCKNCKDIMSDLIYGAGFECQCNNTKQHFYCKYEEKYQKKMEDLKEWLQSFLNQSKSTHTNDDLISNDHQSDYYHDYDREYNMKNAIVSKRQTRNSNVLHHKNKIEKSCVLNGTAHLCKCPSDFRNLLKSCDNSYLFCNQLSSCRNCKEDFYLKRGYGYECECSGIKKHFICRDQDEMVEAYNKIESKLADVFSLVIVSILAFLFFSTIACCCACCIGYISIKCWKNVISKYFKRGIRYNRLQMATNDQSSTVPVQYNRNDKFELDDKNDVAPIYETDPLV